jgi:GH43 family beta-xylosidase
MGRAQFFKIIPFFFNLINSIINNYNPTMKQNHLIILLIIAGLIFNCKPSKQDLQISNPLPVEFGDPYILKASDGVYYMIGTGGVRDGFKMYSSTDLKEWNDEGRIFQGNTDSSWCVANFWAPELYEHEGKFYMFYSADWRENPTEELENFRIGVAVADKPTGPYSDLYNRPVFDPGYPIIDANIFFEDGRVYLYYSRCCYKNPVESELADWARSKGMFDEIEESWIYGVELKPDFSDIIGEPQLLLRPHLLWMMHRLSGKAALLHQVKSTGGGLKVPTSLKKMIPIT